MFARTKRLTLRPGWPEDAAALTAAIAHEAVATRLARMPWPYGRADAEAFLAAPRGATEPSFLILDQAAGVSRIVGGIGLTLTDDGVHELGYWLTPDAWGRGYATEAGRAVLDIAAHALPVRRLRAFHQLENPASGRVLVRLGFRETGRVPRTSLARGGTVDCARLERDPRANAGPERDRDTDTNTAPAPLRPASATMPVAA